jgi:hypothetical protein
VDADGMFACKTVLSSMDLLEASMQASGLLKSKHSIKKHQVPHPLSCTPFLPPCLLPCNLVSRCASAVSMPDAFLDHFSFTLCVSPCVV